MNKTRKQKTAITRAITTLFMLLVLMVSSVNITFADEAAEPDITQGMLIAYNIQNQTIEVPLKHTDVKAEISGMIVDVEVTQTYINTFENPIEAIYVFPLPDDAAVYSMTMQIGNRTIKGIIKQREEAKKIYEQAKAAGKRTSLLEQERPNIFTQSVANILPGDKIIITIKYVNHFEYEDGTYEFVFPMVVGPRYIPGDQIGRQGTGWAGDTTQVPDASRITPPVLKPNERSGHDISIEIKLDAGIEIKEIRSKSHKITVDNINDEKARIVLSQLDSIPNKDLILEYDVAGEKPEFGVLSYKDGDEQEGYFALILQPPEFPTQDQIRPKEMIFVVDNSGSMSGYPIETAKAAMRECISKMNPNDSFQIIKFSQTASGLSPLPLANNFLNIQKGLEFVNAMSGMGGTNMIEGIKAALSYPEDPERMRIVFFMTDGYIGNENQILAAIQDNLGEARIFALGVGSSVNRYLLERMAKLGKGTVQYVRHDEDTTDVVQEFYNRISNPILTDIEIDWGILKVEEVYPENIPDMFSSKPVFIHGKYVSAGSDMIKVKAMYSGKKVSFDMQVEFKESSKEHSALSLIWARHKIEDLMDQMYHGEDEEIVQQVTDLGLKYSLMTKYTSFVAVEEIIERGEFGELKTIAIPVPMPEGVSYEGVFGTEDHAVVESIAGGTAVTTTASSVTTGYQRIKSTFGFGKSAAAEEKEDEGIAVSSGESAVATDADEDKSLFSKLKSWIMLVIALALGLTMLGWKTFESIIKKKRNVMLVSFHEAKTKKMAQTLANETCKKILDVLAEGEQTETDIAKKLGMSLSRVHYNLKALLDAKLIKVKTFHYSEKGREVDHYALTNKYLVIGPPEKTKKKK